MAQIINPIRPDEIYAMTGEKFRYVVREMGDWNMDANQYLTLPHGVGFDKIYAVWGYVRNDADTKKHPICYVKGLLDEYDPAEYAASEDSQEPMITEINATNIILRRQDGGHFDNSQFDSTSYNRGKIIIMYED